MTEVVGEKVLNDRIAVSALGRAGAASEVAEVVLSLFGPAGDFITGQNIIVDGGVVMQ